MKYKYHRQASVTPPSIKVLCLILHFACLTSSTEVLSSPIRLVQGRNTDCSLTEIPILKVKKELISKYMGGRIRPKYGSWLERANGQCPAERTEGEEKERQLHTEEAVRCKTKVNARNPAYGVTERKKKPHSHSPAFHFSQVLPVPPPHLCPLEQVLATSSRTRHAANVSRCDTHSK